MHNCQLWKKGLERAVSPTEVLQRWDGHHQSQDHQHNRWNGRSMMKTRVLSSSEEQLPQPEKRLHHEGRHGAMAMRPLGPPAGTQMTLAEIVENDEPLNETMGQIHLLKMMTMKKNTQGAPSKGLKAQHGLLDTGFGDVAQAPSRTWTLVKRAQQ